MLLGSTLIERRNQFGNLLELNLLAYCIKPKLVSFPHILDGLLQVVARQSSGKSWIEEVERIELRHVLKAKHIREEYLRYVVPRGTDFFGTVYDFGSLRVGHHNRIERSGELRFEPILQCPTVLAHIKQKWLVRN